MTDHEHERALEDEVLESSLVRRSARAGGAVTVSMLLLFALLAGAAWLEHQFPRAERFAPSGYR